MTRYLSTAATLSPNERHRYTLDRVWSPRAARVVVIGVNPSTADANKDDPTIIRCVGFAQAAGGCSLRMVNLFSWRATEVKELLTAPYPAGSPDNDLAIAESVKGAHLVIAAWGSKSGRLGDRVRRRARELLDGALRGVPLHALRLTEKGDPEHPLFLPKSCKPFPYEVRRG